MTVVAVIVAHDPGQWFDEALTSFATQDYAELSVLILDCASADDLTARLQKRLAELEQERRLSPLPPVVPDRGQAVLAP